MTDLAMPTDADTAETRYLLPPEAYWTQDWYEREMRDLFAKTWNLAAYASDIPNPGDYLPVTIGAEPVLLVRDGDHEIRGFVNMCRHRGMALMSEPGHTDGNLRCFYHGWEFEPSGTLVRIPQRATQFPSIDTSEWSLIPLPTAVFDGMVFVNPSADAEPFEEWLGDFEANRGPFQTDLLEEVVRLRIPIGCNWKLYIENHIDVLHLWYLHAETLGSYDHNKFAHYRIGRHWASDERLRDPSLREEGGLPPIEHLPETERDVLRANLLFPNVPSASNESMTMTYQVVPTGPTTCELDIRVRAEPGSAMSDEALAHTRRVLVEEDGFAVEQIQRTIRSQRFAVGPLAEVHERPITDFHNDILEFLV